MSSCHFSKLHMKKNEKNLCFWIKTRFCLWFFVSSQRSFERRSWGTERRSTVPHRTCRSEQSPVVGMPKWRGEGFRFIACSRTRWTRWTRWTRVCRPWCLWVGARDCWWAHELMSFGIAWLPAALLNSALATKKSLYRCGHVRIVRIRPGIHTISYHHSTISLWRFFGVLVSL